MKKNFSSEFSGEERRQFLRVPTECEVVARKIHYATDGVVKMWGELKNISSGGVLFVCEQGCCTADEVKITITLPEHLRGEPGFPRATRDDQPLTVAAVCKVLRSEQLPDGRCEVAAEFVRVFNEDQNTLAAFVETEAGRLGIPEPAVA